MIAYNIDYSELDAKQIMNLYNVSEMVAEYLEMIHPDKSKDWQEYEEIKDFLYEVCSSAEEYEGANKCLIDRMKI